jgi:ubiquinone/menaquinone biosynthesis C-methylase UbiE
MPQNVYDNPDFFNEYITFPRQAQGLDGAPEWPSVRAILPDLTGKRVVDLGCGFGWFARWARENGAEKVLALDVSEKMLERARSDTTDTSIEYRIQDLEVLELPEASFDFAYSALAFHYIEDFTRLVRVIHKALTPGSHFVFEIEHPIYMAAYNADWIEFGARKTWPVNAYAVEGERRNDWLVKGVLKYHRTMSTTINTLIGAGFTIEQLQEYSPTETELARTPELAPQLERPIFLVIKACRE